MSGGAPSDKRRVLGAMRSGEWLRTQWILRVAFDVAPGGDYRPLMPRTRQALKALARDGRIERRDATERRDGEVAGMPVAFDIPRDEWRLAAGQRGD